MQPPAMLSAENEPDPRGAARRTEEAAVDPVPEAPALTNVRRPGSGVWWTLGRHQLGALAATLLDFGTMVTCVQRFGLSADAGTAIGASVGALTNFLLARAWIFRRQSGHWAGQAVRYALVSGGGAVWNTLGEHLMHDIEHVQYVAARAVVSVAVSLLWNFPMQRRFVFREGRGR